MKTRAAIYTRVSTEQQVEKYSLAAQRRLLREHARNKGWEIVAEYEDPGISGETIEGRPAFRELLDAARASRFDILLTVDTDRLSRSRDLRMLAEIQEAMQQGRVKIATPSQIFDPENEEDVFLSHLFGILAAREKAKILRRTRLGMEQAVREGRKMGCSRDPYGYRYDRNLRHLVIREEEVPIVRLCFDLYLKGTSVERIARTLDAEGFKSRCGENFWAATVQSILTNPVHAGYAVWRPRGKHDRADPKNWIWPEKPSHEAIIEFSTWEKAQAARARRSRSTKPMNYGASPFILSGILRCHCGQPMHGHSTTPRGKENPRKLRRYRCGSYRRGLPTHPMRNAEGLEEAVVSKVALLGESSEFLEKARRRTLLDRMRTGTNAGAELDRLRAELDRVRRKQDILYDDRLEGRISEGQWVRFNQTLLSDEEGLERKLSRAEEDLLSDPMGPERASRVLEVLADFRRLFATLDPQAKKRLLRSVVAEVKINKDKDRLPEIRLLEPWATLLEPEAGDAAAPEALSETA